MICNNCGKEIPDNSSFCNECGKKIEHIQEKSTNKDTVTKSISNGIKNTLKIGISAMIGAAFLIIVIMLTLFYGISSNGGNSSSDNQVSSKMTEFSTEQKDFLNSIGVKNTDIAYEDSNKLLVLEGNSDVVKSGHISVALDENKGISAVYYGFGDHNNILWSAEKGKVGYTIEDANTLLENFISTHSSEYDQATGQTSVDNYGSLPFGHKGMFLNLYYMGQGEAYKDPNTIKDIRVLLHYSDEDWIFFNKVIFSNSQNNFEYNVPNQPRHKVVRGGVHETEIASIPDIIEGLNILVTGENPQIDFIGTHGRASVAITPSEVENIKQYIELHKAIYSQMGL